MSTEDTHHDSSPQRELEPNEVPLSTLDVGDVFSFNDDDPRYELIDMKFLGEHRDNVWAYANAETGEFEGLIRDGACPAHFPEPVVPHDTEQ
ncbi:MULTISPECIES: hypothetical protein [Haloferacaceae]|uniref:Uncharacterized protein n=2 Tax=Haloferacaceae TaxID=1644056 RepID=A0ABD6DAJ4_9EURY|nr:MULTISPECIES: hypothetical protein [Halorubraceae]CDK38156.1 hypothetical protein BN903_356 [Halorubrum sp. AJ67]